MTPEELDPRTLAGQRWFAGKHRTLAHVLDGGSVPLPGGDLALAQARYADEGTAELYLLPGDGIDWPRTLRALLSGPAVGTAGELRLRLGPRTRPQDLPLSGPGRISVPSLDQSNTLLAIDEALLIKLYRRPLPGVHPEVEIGEALIGAEAPVARHYGALELTSPGGEVLVIGCLQEFVAGAEGGWEWPIGLAMQDLRVDGPSAAVSALAAGAGAMLGRLHVALAELLGTLPAAADGELEEYRSAQALIGEFAAVDALPATALGAVGPGLEALLAPGERRQRIHGDLHIAQLLSRGERLTVIDFEGNPTLPLAARRAPASPLRDLATLRRSFDHVATAAARRVDPPPGRAAAWSERVIAELTAAYGGVAGVVRVDPARLHAFDVAAELRELHYARTVLPEWAYVALAGLERLAAATTSLERTTET